MPWTPPPHDRKIELRDHLSAAAWRVAMVEICARHELDGGALAPVLSGSDVVWSTSDHVIKMTTPCWKDEIDAEAHWSTYIQGQLGVRTPEIRATGKLSGWPYVVMSRVPGVSIGTIWPDLARSERLRLAADLGRLTRELHEIELDGEVDDWASFWSTCRSGVTARHAHEDVPRELVNAIDPFLEFVGDLESTARVLLHTELLDEHILVEDRAGRFELCALIDFADGRVGPPEYEFAAPVEFIFRGEERLLRAFLRAYGLAADELTPERSLRMLAWALLHRFGSLQRMLRLVAPWRPATLRELALRLYTLE